jgi:regulator of nucleoside diphosphate kinase
MHAAVQRPAIFLTPADAARLRALAANENIARNPVVEMLTEELARAVVCPADEMPARIVRIGSRVRYVDDTASTLREIRIVMPEDAAPERGAVSVLDLVAAALLGLPEDQSLRWHDADGRQREVRVVQVLDDFLWR